MYARDLMIWLHERLSERGTFGQTQERFEKLRGYGLLPRGRENAGIRLSNKQIANCVLGFAHPLPGLAGHASLVLGGLQPVGGRVISFKGASNLREAVSRLIGERDAGFDLLRLTLSVEQDFSGEEYTAALYYQEKDQVKTVSFVSKYAFSLLKPGTEKVYLHERLSKPSAVQRSLGPSFFQDLSHAVSISRHLNRPLKTDWLEYETEEEKSEFHRRLGARPSSRFLNLRVDALVAWPNQPTRMEFGGYQFVLFPKTKDHSHSISIDLNYKRISAEDARSLINRMLSVMCWCDNQPASLHEGWGGSPIPAPVPRLDMAFVTMSEWLFCRKLPDDENLRRCLAFYRDGLNAYSVGLASHAVLSFFRVFETRYDKKKKVVNWVNAVFREVKPSISENELQRFEADRQSAETDPGTYVYENCRVATAHAARDMHSDPDETAESRRLLTASQIIKHFARYFIKQEFKFSTSYLVDDSRV